MKKLIALILSCIFLGGCGTGSLGTYSNPLKPESAPNKDQRYATVVFYRTDSLFSGIMTPDECIALINYDKNKQKYSRSEFLGATRSGYTEAKLSPGIYKFSLVTLISNDRSAQTAQLNAGETYYLSLVFRHIPPFILNPLPALRFTSEEEFLKKADGLSEMRIIKDLNLGFFDPDSWKDRYEVINIK